ncbi:MAG: UDP-N-acetylglucosamine 2-epimerase (non-hydrolyzing) [Flavobacteriales bacterium]|nr:UDP-N-acetylglucosamine 2-epimerase (non-hydrolyzing) [Flavobacteriales bacterium]
MIKILTIVGARPQLIKAAAISRAIRTVYPDKIQEVILHTGQHYDKNMSEVFFTELSIPRPEVNLNVGSGSHGSQTANMLEGIERAILDHQPDVLVIYGDTNSTCAGALAAAKLHVPIVHIEAGLRSFNKRMPEEVNRITADHMSTLLFSPNKSGIENLIKEGFNINSTAPHSIDNPKVYQCGDIMYDNSLHFSSIADGKAGIKKELNLGNGDYILSTVHRPSNTDDPANLSQIFEAFLELVKKGNLILMPLHPRTVAAMKRNLKPDLMAEIEACEKIKLLPPASFLEIIDLEKDAKMLVSDSGGMQKEAFFFNKPCVVLRNETEWVELVENGNAILTGPDKKKILNAVSHFESVNNLTFPAFYGDGKAAEFICSEIITQLSVN